MNFLLKRRTRRHAAEVLWTVALLEEIRKWIGPIFGHYLSPLGGNAIEVLARATRL